MNVEDKEQLKQISARLDWADGELDGLKTADWKHHEGNLSWQYSTVYQGRTYWMSHKGYCEIMTICPDSGEAIVCGPPV